MCVYLHVSAGMIGMYLYLYVSAGMLGMCGYVPHAPPPDQPLEMGLVFTKTSMRLETSDAMRALQARPANPTWSYWP
jgi:hypothetical protein